MNDREETRKTSKFAWLSTRPYAETMECMILQLLEEKEMTDDEIEVATAMRHQSVSATRRSLVKRGLVEATTKKRATRSGRLAVVWRLSATAPEAKEESNACPF